jgi:hypothetical protein
VPHDGRHFAGAAYILTAFVQRMEGAHCTYSVCRGRSLPADIPIYRALAKILATQDPTRIAYHKLQKYWRPTPFPFD